MTKTDQVYQNLKIVAAAGRDKTLLGVAIDRIVELEDEIRELKNVGAAPADQDEQPH